jgi:hypothetical protein
MNTNKLIENGGSKWFVGKTLGAKVLPILKCFVLIRLFQPSLMFACKARAYP